MVLINTKFTRDSLKKFQSLLGLAATRAGKPGERVGQLAILFYEGGEIHILVDKLPKNTAYKKNKKSRSLIKVHNCNV